MNVAPLATRLSQQAFGLGRIIGKRLQAGSARAGEVQWVAAPVSRFPDVHDELLTEGYLSWPVEPWQIPYRALLPRREECTNLVVPVCISASHVAFNGFRLEPQYMIAGEAAGVAAALAARNVTALHDVPIDELQQRLRAGGAVLSLG